MKILLAVILAVVGLYVGVVVGMAMTNVALLTNEEKPLRFIMSALIGGGGLAIVGAMIGEKIDVYSKANALGQDQTPKLGFGSLILAARNRLFQFNF